VSFVKDIFLFVELDVGGCVVCVMYFECVYFFVMGMMKFDFV